MIRRLLLNVSDALARPVAVLAVAESMAYGRMARHVFDQSLPAALPLTLSFFFLVPMAAGYRSVASSDEPRVGVLTPTTALLIMLSAWVAQGWTAMLLVILWTPCAMLFALLGGALALMVRKACHTAPHVTERFIRAAKSLRRGRERIRIADSRAEHAPVRLSWIAGEGRPRSVSTLRPEAGEEMPDTGTPRSPVDDRGVLF